MNLQLSNRLLSPPSTRQIPFNNEYFSAFRRYAVRILPIDTSNGSRIEVWREPISHNIRSRRHALRSKLSKSGIPNERHRRMAGVVLVAITGTGLRARVDPSELGPAGHNSWVQS